MTDAWKQQEGQVVDGRFRLIQFLGGTDHSAVFLTEFGEKRQRLAIKLIGADPNDVDTQFARLRRAAKLSHPHLAHIFQCGRAQVGSASVLYVITEYAEEDLAQILPDRALRPEEVREILPQIIEALQYLHSQGFVHSRIKPSNVLAVDEQLKLSIDGVCVAGERNAPGEKPSAYDPPEMAPSGPSPAGDVWSLGMTIVEVLTQRLPVWEWTGHADPPAPRTLPAPFLEITRNCLRRDTAMRCTLREISENLDPQVGSTAAPSGAAVAYSAAAPATRVEWSPEPGSPPAQDLPPHRSNSRYIIQAAAFVIVLAVVLLTPRLFRSSHKPLESDPVAEAAPPTSQPKPEPATPAAKVDIAKAREKTSVSPASVSPVILPKPAAETSPSHASIDAHGRVTHEVLPEVSPRARDTIRGKVRVSVRLSVDPSGKVAGAAFEAPGPSTYFADAAIRAAKNWTFAPAKANGENVASQWLVRFEFDNAATNVFPTELKP